MVQQMDQWVRDLKGKVIIEGAGHWVKAEKPGPVNEALLGFLKSVTT
jgi:pimeloyl-ACP methyl ester carboxylesterase